ncbi:uncharacterized protein LOC116188369 isoform X1 [Punica granatum]|uniref:Uncharacterized protein LOC116188369 isoform X1 n=1 Tax=Punica granatum TaxID=22663 RepID=A0A6P8BT88_PUNGR|nr:uncharacterized protein LOC116188369 isoform X1 [Punica granatum]
MGWLKLNLFFLRSLISVNFIKEILSDIKEDLLGMLHIFGSRSLYLWRLNVDGRKISVGDCALFKLPQDSPPSIGLVYRVTVTKEKNLKLGVNWLYRPTEVKLGKGILLEAAPNEIFYSLKKDEIPAASLLHPCKVAFLPKGVELPRGISSFVCRRVYDIANRRLWWLTDKDHFNEEVEQLLYKTRIEMHASAQPNGRSPKQTSGPMSSHLKPGADGLQNNASLPSQSKGKKRERQDQGTELVKRERSSKMGDGDSGRSSSESSLKSEIAKVVEKGPLVDTEGVDRLVQAMFFEINERKIDLSARTMLTSIIVATEKSDCLSRFVQIRGLSILDDWLQDVHKGKTGDSSGLKDNDKVAEEFLLVLLRALDKLPVNLPALQMCNIGKSVNHLRTHKNLEIQKKARSLVDTWKKRVEVEMNINDAKMSSNQTVSGSARSRLPEAPHANKNIGGSSEGAPRSPTVQLSASKAAPAKLLQGETASKSASQFQGSMKLATAQTSPNVNLRDGQPRISSSLSDVPLTTSRDEKSSSSSPSHNSSHSCSGDHVKAGGSAVKEDARSSAGASSNKVPCLASRHRKSVNGFPVSAASARESGSSRSTSLHRNVAPDKASQSGLTSEKAADVAPEVNSHKFIVKIPTRSRSPAQRAAGGSVDDLSMMNSRPSSPAHLERPDQLGTVVEGRADASQANVSSDANVESWQGDDFRDPPTACGPLDRDLGEDHCNIDENTKKTQVVSKCTTSSPRNTLKLGKALEPSLSPMNALIESCVNYVEANAPVPIGDDVGMHLLASVAAGEMFKSEPASPDGSPHGDPSSMEPSCKANDLEVKPVSQDSYLRNDDASKGLVSECAQRDHFEGSALMSSKGDGKTYPLCIDERAGEAQDVRLNSSSVNGDQTAAPSSGSNKVRNDLAVAASISEAGIYSEEGKESKESASLEGSHLDGTIDEKVKVDTSILPEGRVINDSLAVKSEEAAEVGTMSGKEGGKPEKDLDDQGQVEEKPTLMILCKPTYEQDMKTVDGLKAAEVSEKDAVNKSKQNEKPDPSIALGVQTVAGPASGIEKHVESEAASEKKVGGALSEPSTDLNGQYMDARGESRGCDVPSSKEADEMEKCNLSSAHASIARPSDGDTKLEFDLNEGFSTEDGKYGGSVNFNPPASSAAAVPLISPMPVASSSPSAGLSAPIAVAAAAAKGPFVPTDDLLRAKVEIGWKGSAATSAFRPAEPRKITEMPTVSAYTTHSPDISSGRQNRPLLDFDLNVPDERINEDAAPQYSLETSSLYNSRSNFEKAHQEMAGSVPPRTSGGLGLDLNRVDEAPTDSVNYSTSNRRKPNAVACRDFDLNDGPVIDAAEPSTSGQQQQRINVFSHQQPVHGLRVNSAEVGNFSTWFHPASTYSSVTVPSILSDRGEQSYPIVAGGGPPRMLGPSTGGGIPFNTEMYGGPVLSSSPAVPFPSAPFQYSIFPFGTSFPLPSATLSGNATTYVDPSSGGRLGFPPVHSQLVGPAGTVASQFSRPYAVNLSDGSGNSAIESNKKWSRQGLDLNTGPGGPELEGRDETSPLGLRQLSIAGPQSLAEEQARMYQVSSGLLKRKEPEGRWDGYRQSSWQQ